MRSKHLEANRGDVLVLNGADWQVCVAIRGGATTRRCLGARMSVGGTKYAPCFVPHQLFPCALPVGRNSAKVLFQWPFRGIN